MNTHLLNAEMINLDARSPTERYAEALNSGHFIPDAAQKKAVAVLDQLYQHLLHRFLQSQEFHLHHTTAPNGMYLWGGIGRGKTWLMDQFYAAIPFRRKMRLHFAHFMQRIHHELHLLQGQSDPLEKVADLIYQEAVVICFDEFFINNVTDAMILGDLFIMLFKRGVTLVATSNVAPDELYKDGIQRNRFLPAIEAIKQYCTVFNLDSGIDYRLRVLKQENLYCSPLGPETSDWLAGRFAALTHHQEVSYQDLIINSRTIAVIGRTDDVFWCSFDELCVKPRSAADFIEITKLYNTILIGDVPILNDQIADATRRLVYLVDELYDRRVKVVMTAQQPISELYTGTELDFEMQRTRSRLLEMQSDDYLTQEHRQTD